MELQTTLSATLKKNPNCCYIAIFKCNLPKEPWKQNKIVVMLQASSVIYQRKHKLLYTKPKKNTIVTHPTKENAKFFFLKTTKFFETKIIKTYMKWMIKTKIMMALCSSYLPRQKKREESNNGNGGWAWERAKSQGLKFETEEVCR